MNNLTRELSVLSWLLVKAILIGILGSGAFFFEIYVMEGGFNYSLFITCVVSGLLWNLLPSFHLEYLNKMGVKENGKRKRT